MSADCKDAEKVISISLNKIASFRRISGSLHKNLLVAHVLNRARSAYMEETLQIGQDSFPDDTPKGYFTSRDSDAPDFLDNDGLMPPNPVVVTEVKCENVWAEPTRQSEETYDIDEDSDTDEPDNRIEIVELENGKHSLKETSCKMLCLKRKHHADMDYVTINYILPKRQRYDTYGSDLDTDSEISFYIDEDSDSDYVCTCDDLTADCRCDQTVMDTDYNKEQMSSLVNIFSRGFSGLCEEGEKESCEAVCRSPDLCSTHVQTVRVESVSRTLLECAV